MTRKEERERKAEIRADQYSYPAEWNDCYHHWLEGAEWADRTMLNKVYDFIIANVYKYGKVKFVENRATFDFRMNTFLNDLKQAMEE